ncbi:conserved hypothetical protein [Bradyrhizobium sp. ORS 375]|uniref:hypothetical protein n=1 Tax=Bradyrhizobium sp. (strain ORS 375) TaxID=566679 RepID=UPI0002406EE6|nr:hypothetical protein [Bradyrhizobium sp. ORS 375]CCD93119.1 conserved hypothetical protein [Bradyrhizobium sp. ORS 375]
MTVALVIAVAVGLTSAVGYLLLVLNDRRRQGSRRWSSDGGSLDASSGSGFNLGNWFSNTATDVMGNPIDGGGDSGGDGGGGDGGGGD